MEFFNNLLIAKDSLINGLMNTLVASVFAIILGTLFGILIGIVLCYGNKYIKMPFRLFIDIVRGIPGLVIVFTVYYLVDFALKMVGITLSSTMSGIIALTVTSSVQIAELTRGALQNIDKGQVEAGKAIGLKFSQIFKLILLPQALVQMIPPWTNSATEIVKGSTLLSLIGTTELLLTAKQLVAVNGNALQYYLFIGIIFLLTNSGIEYFGKCMEKRLSFEIK